MNEISSFRGMAGEVVNGFLRLRTFATAIFMVVVIAIAIFFLGLLAGALPQKPPAFVLSVLMYILPTFLVARFALASSRGDVHSEFFNGSLESGEVLGFVARYTVLTLMWMIPMVGLSWLFKLDLSLNPMSAMPSAASFSFSTFKVLMVSILAFVIKMTYIFAPILSVVMATYTSSVKELFEFESWEWLFNDRRGDIIPLIAAVIGATVVFFVIYFIPIAFLSFLLTKVLYVAKVNPWSIGGLIASFVSLLFLSFTLIVLGRLSGAFVAGEDEIFVGEESEETTAVNMLASGDSVVAKAAAEHLVKKSTTVVDAKSIQEKVEALDDEVIVNCVNQALAELEKDEEQLSARVELVYLYLRLEDSAKAVEHANVVLSDSLDNSMPKVSLVVFHAVSKLRSKLSLRPEQWPKLGQILADNHDFLDSCWAVYCGAALDSSLDNIDVHKQVITIADNASRVGNHQQAYAVFHFFVNKFPNSTLLEFAQGAMDIEKQKIENQT